MPVRDALLLPMSESSDFEAYETFVALCMKPDDYYRADELRQHVASGYVSAWSVQDIQGRMIGWCGLNNWNKQFADAWNFLGLAVHPEYRTSALALRMIRHVMAQGGNARDATVYIQPGVATEKIVQRLGFRYVADERPWRIYLRHKV